MPLSRASVGMPLSFMNLYRASRGMRRNLLPGTRNPLSCPLSKQRMMVCCETLQIFAASPVVNTVFMRASAWPAQPARMGEIRARPNDRAGLRTENPSVTHAGHLVCPHHRARTRCRGRTRRGRKSHVPGERQGCETWWSGGNCLTPSYPGSPSDQRCGTDAAGVEHTPDPSSARTTRTVSPVRPVPRPNFRLPTFPSTRFPLLPTRSQGSSTAHLTQPSRFCQLSAARKWKPCGLCGPSESAAPDRSRG